jgi:chromate transporter
VTVSLPSASKRSEQPSLAELAFVFLKLGTTAFGGPAAHIAMMEQEFVQRRKWLSEGEFLDLLGAANLIPGPSSTEMAIFIGHTMRGWRGLIVAGCCFIIPAAILVLLIAAAYVRYGALPQVGSMLYAIKPVVIAIVIQAFWKLTRTAIKTVLLAVVAGGAAILSLLGINILVVLVLAGIASIIGWLANPSKRPALAALLRGPFKSVAAISSAVLGTLAAPFSLLRLFLTFLKIGSVLFGGGYVLLAFVQADFVNRLHWLTERQLLDAVAVGQFTPGPVFTTATFIGYLLAGVPGAVVATIGIFLPGFIFVAVSGPLIPAIRRSPMAGAALDGIVAGSLALMGVVAWQLGRTSITDWTAGIIAVASASILLLFQINSAWLIAAAALVGWLMRT